MLLGERSVDVVLLDLMLPDKNGLEVLEDIRRLDEELPVIMITAFGTIEGAVAATKQGAFYYLPKPFKNDEVLAIVRNAVERRRLVLENRELRNRLRSGSHRFDEIVGGSSKIRAVYDLIARAAPSRATVLIQGESGTGKELVAQALHRRSARADKAFVTVNSGNLPPDLLESNLFGHVKGAFTGAVYPKKGLFEARRQRHDLLRRNRQHPDGDAAQAAARHPGTRVHASWRRGHDQGRRADHRGDERQPAPHGRDRRLPRGSVLPAQRHPRAAAAATRPDGRRAAARAALSRQVQDRERQTGR